MKTKLVIGVTALNAIDSPGPGIAVIRSLKESQKFDVRIIGLAYEYLEPGIYMHDLVDKSYQIPLPGAGIEALWQRLSYIHQKENMHVLIPNFDAELFNFIQLAERLAAVGIRTFLPSVEQFESRHKTNLPELGKLSNILVPETRSLNSLKDVKNVSKEWPFPFFIKGRFYDAIRVFSEEQANAAFHKLAAAWGYPVIAQKHVAGEEVNVTAIGDGKGATLGAVAMKKMYVTDKGKAWSGISIADQTLLGHSQDLIKALKWPGGLELEWIKDNNGNYQLLEINPRFPAWVYLATGCGQNHPELLVQLALGEPPETKIAYETGKLFVRFSFDLLVDIHDFEKITTKGEL